MINRHFSPNISFRMHELKKNPKFKLYTFLGICLCTTNNIGYCRCNLCSMFEQETIPTAGKGLVSLCHQMSSSLFSNNSKNSLRVRATVVDQIVPKCIRKVVCTRRVRAWEWKAGMDDKQGASSNKYCHKIVVVIKG